MDFDAAMKWLSLGQAVFAAGSGAWAKVRGVLAEQGLEQELAALDAVIVDAERREAMARRDADGGMAPMLNNGSNGE